MARSLLIVVATYLGILGLTVAQASEALAQGKPGGKVTGALEMLNLLNQNVTRRHFNVQELEGSPAKGWVKSEVLSGPNAGAFFAADVTCAVVNSVPTMVDWAMIEDHEGLFAAIVTLTDGHTGPGGGDPEYILTYVKDGGEPSKEVDELRDMFIDMGQFNDFCAWIAGAGTWPKPAVVDELLSGAEKESIGDGNMQVHLD